MRYLLRIENFLIDAFEHADLFRPHVVGEIPDGKYAVQGGAGLRGLRRKLKQRRPKIGGGIRVLLLDMDIADDAECTGEKRMLIHIVGLS